MTRIVSSSCILYTLFKLKNKQDPADCNRNHPVEMQNRILFVKKKIDNLLTNVKKVKPNFKVLWTYLFECITHIKQIFLGILLIYRGNTLFIHFYFYGNNCYSFRMNPTGDNNWCVF